MKKKKVNKYIRAAIAYDVGIQNAKEKNFSDGKVKFLKRQLNGALKKLEKFNLL